MAYYVRVFCTAIEVPCLESVADWVASKGMRLDIIPGRGALYSKDWSEAEISHAGRAVWFHVEVNRTGAKSDIAHRELDEFREAAAARHASAQRQEVLDHLAQTKFVIANRVPTAAFQSSDYDALGYFCEFFIIHAGGMVQADGEGFYRGKELILPLR